MNKQIPESTVEEENEFLKKNIIGLEVTGASCDNECGLIIEFGGIWRMVLYRDGYMWEHRKPQ